MFKLSESTDPITDWPVEVNKPVSGGKVQRHTFKADFLVLPVDELAEVADEDLHKVIVGWSGVADHEGNELPYSVENLQRLLRISYVRVGLLAAYRNCLAGFRGKN